MPESHEQSQSNAADGVASTGDGVAYTLPEEAMTQVLEAIRTEDDEALAHLIDPLHPADVADLLEQVSPSVRQDLVRLYGHHFGGEVLSELDERLREEVITALRPEVLAGAVRALDTDDVVDLVADLEAPQQATILGALEGGVRTLIEDSLNYPDDTAGRIMQREVVCAPECWSVGMAIDFMRTAEHLPDQFYHVILVDARMHPVAQVGLGKIMGHTRETALNSLADPVFEIIPARQGSADIAYAFNQYHLISAPVVDDHGRLVGVITIDDAMEMLDGQHEEDMLRLAGVDERHTLSDSVFSTAGRRLPWLGVNLATAILASLVIAVYEEAIARVVALAVLMPIVASMGGNAGTQSLTVVVRALATRDLTNANLGRIVRRELLVGMLNGALFALAMGTVGMIWFGSPVLAVTAGIAMFANLVAAGLSGTGIPVMLGRLGVDPALASGAFVTTVTDVIGFFAFLGLAAAILI